MKAIKPMDVFGKSKKDNKDDNLEIVYAEILIGLFGRAKKMVIEDATTEKKVEIDKFL